MGLEDGGAWETDHPGLEVTGGSGSHCQCGRTTQLLAGGKSRGQAGSPLSTQGSGHGTAARSLVGWPRSHAPSPESHWEGTRLTQGTMQARYLSRVA